MTSASEPQRLEALETLAHEASELSPLPVVASRLLSMAADARFSPHDLAGAVSTDPALTLRILRLSNSAMFGLPRRVTTLREAIVLLGFREVRALALAACVVDASSSGVSEESLVEFDRFWENAVAVGLLAQLLAGAEGGDSDEAFTAGIVYNVGRLAWAQRRPSWMRACVVQARETRRSVHEVQAQMFGFNDADTGAAIVRNWNFPETLCAAVARHAEPIEAFDAQHSLDAIVARARHFARCNGITDGVDPPLDSPPEPRWQDPRIVDALARLGGLEAVTERAGAFLGDGLAA